MNTNTETGLGLLPAIKRARGYRLYAEGGKRFLDLWQDDGYGVLGAKGTGVGTVAKAGLDKGLASPLPSIYERRLTKALLELYPDYRAACAFVDREAAALALAKVFGGRDRISGGLSLNDLVLDPALRPIPAAPTEGKLALLLRPFGEYLAAEAAAAESMGAALVRLPCPRSLSPSVLLFKRPEDAAAIAHNPVPPVLLASAVKSLAEYKAYRASVGEALWKKADARLCRLFERRGPYLFPKCAAADYSRLFESALQRGVLLSPEFGRPSMLPGEFDDGELKPLAEISL